MNLNKSDYIMIQKYPMFIKLRQSHPCRNNLKPVYIDKVNGNHKISSKVTPNTATPINDIKVETADNIINTDIGYEKVSNCNSILNEELKDQSSTSTYIFKEDWTLDELLDLNIKEIPYLVENLIPNESLVILAGPSDVGKSTFYHQLSIAIIRGDKEFLGFKLNPVHRRVLIVSTEDGPIALAFRAQRQTSDKKLNREISRNLKFFFTHDDLENRICKYLDKHPVDLIIIDAFGDVFNGDINSSNTVRAYLGKFNKIIQKYKCSILFVHHICKGKKPQRMEKDQLLGSTGIVGKVRSVIMLNIINSQHQLSIVKGNYVNNEEKEKITYLHFNQSTLTFSPVFNYQEVEEVEDVENVKHWPRMLPAKKIRPGRKKDMDLYNLAVKLYNEGMSQVEIAKRVVRDKSTVCKWIKEYKESKGYDLSKAEDVD